MIIIVLGWLAVVFYIVPSIICLCMMVYYLIKYRRIPDVVEQLGGKLPVILFPEANIIGIIGIPTMVHEILKKDREEVLRKYVESYPDECAVIMSEYTKEKMKVD